MHKKEVYLSNKGLKRCWQKCKECQVKFKDIETEYVHMKFYINGLFYVCDKCNEESN